MRAGLRLIAALVATCAIAGAVAVAPAGATIYWQHGNDIWKMRDDGTGKTAVVSASSLSAKDLSDVHVRPAGSTLVFEANQGGYSHYSTAIYKYAAGAATRLSPWSSSCTPSGSADECLSGEYEPEITADDKVVFWYGYYEINDFNVGEVGYVRRRPLAGGAASDWGTRCDGAGDDAKSPSPNPANAAQIAYVGCSDPSIDYALIISGPARSGERIVVTDDLQQRDPSWSSNGQVVVTAEDGSVPGLWFNFIGSTFSFRHVLQAPSAKVSAPHFVDTNPAYVVFAADGDIWRIPATCSACTYPANATRLTTDGTSVVDAGPAWTSAGNPVVGAGTASVASGQLRFTAAAGRTNTVTVSLVSGRYRIKDTTSPVTPSTGCTAVSANEASCSTTGVTSFRGDLGNYNDKLTSSVSLTTTLIGGDGNDSLTGGPGIDTLDGGLGADVMAGGAGTDAATYASRTSAVVADIDGVADDGSSSDGPAGARDNVKGDVESLTGGSGNDTLTGSSVNNVLDGGTGADVLSGLGGTDRVSYATRTGAVVVDIDGIADDGSSADGPAGARDNVKTDIESLTGGAGADSLTGSAAVNRLTGGKGADTLLGLAGNDVLDAADDVKDTKIDCGTGSDQTIFDSGLDPASLGCETKTPG